MHCDTTCNIFNGDQIAGGFGITDARHKLHPTAVFVTKAKGLDTDKYKKIMRKIMDVTAAIVLAELNIELQEDTYVWSMSDFDKALTNAMKETFDDRHGGCEFHLYKAVKPKLALLSDQDRADECKSWIRFLMRSTTQEQLDYFRTVFDNWLDDEGRFKKPPPPPPLLLLPRPTTARRQFSQPLIQIRTAWHALWCADTGTIRGATTFSRCVTSLLSQRKTTIPWSDSFARCIGCVLCNTLSRCVTLYAMPPVVHPRRPCQAFVVLRIVCGDGCADEGAHSQAAPLFRSSDAQSLEVHAQHERWGG